MKCAHDQSTQKTLAARIGQLYLCATAPFQLSEEILKDVLCGKNGCPNYDEEMAILTQAQRRVMDSLQSYWCKQFLSVVHHKTSPYNYDEAIFDQEEVSGSTSSWPQVIIDRGEEGFQKRAAKLPPIVNTSTVHTYADTLCYNTTCQLPQLLVTPSTQRLFQASNIPPNPHLASSSGFQKRVHQQQQLSYLQSSLRCNLSAGAPLSHFLKSSKCHSSGNSATNLLLFWTSVENLLTRDELRKWHNRHCTVRKAGSNSAYSFLLDDHPFAKNLESLLELHLLQASPYSIQLPASMKDQLQTLLPKGLGHSILLSAQEYVSQVFCQF